MGKFTGPLFRILSLIFIILVTSCSKKEDVPVANFNIEEIAGDYTAQLKMDFSGPRPAVSVFGGTMTVSLTGSDTFSMFIDFPDDYITTELTGNVIEKIVNTSNSTLGGISFSVQETDELMANTDPLVLINVKDRSGAMKTAYATFLETANGLSMVLYMIEKNDSPTEFEFKAIKD